MEAKTICLDTNIIIDFFRKGNKENSILYKIKEQYNFCLSVVSVFEIEIGIKSEHQQNEYISIMENVEVLANTYIYGNLDQQNQGGSQNRNTINKEN